MQATVILAGASVRSLAESAVQTGLHPVCVDMFADLDLQQLLREAGHPPPICCSGFDQLPAALQTLPSSVPLVWTGGLENHPAVLQHLRQTRPVCGVAADQLPRLRTAEGLQAILSDADCQLPETAPANFQPSDRILNSRWLVKSTRGSGGLGVRWFHPDAPATASDCLQEYIPGQPISALYHNDGQTTQLLSVSLQIIGESTQGCDEFAFGGNIGPVQPPPSVTQTLTQVGRRIADGRLVGVFGVDFVLRGSDVWLIEVNPRITASHELFDLLHPERLPVLQRHLQTVTGHRARVSGDRSPEKPSTMLARQIIYQRRDTSIDSDVTNRLLKCRRPLSGRTLPAHWVADIPQPGPLTAGQPCCSVYHLLHKVDNRWTAGGGQRSVETDRLLAEITGIDALRTAETAVRRASLFESRPDSDNG